MCGIIGYIGRKNIFDVLINGLKRLEYRGYDSAGVAVLSPKNIFILKKVGKVSALESVIVNSTYNTEELGISVGIAHTRWATHGEPSDINAHPHIDCIGKIAVVHNGIIENYQTLRKKLESLGHIFKSQTDTEVIAHLIEEVYKETQDFEKAVQIALMNVEGTYGLAIISSYDPEKIVIARKGSPIIIGLGSGEYVVASDASAIVDITRNVVYLEDGEMGIISKDGVEIRKIASKGEELLLNLDGRIHELTFSLEEIEKGGFPHFMLKEIFEQPESIQNSIRGRINDNGSVKLGGISDVLDKVLNARRFIITACGTSWHAGLVGKYMLEQYAEIPVEVEYASEFRYRNPVIFPDDVVWVISQSGETADTLAALRLAKSKGATVLGIVNVVGSTIARESHAGIYIHAGPEIGVASTKAFTSQLAVLSLLTLFLGREKGKISAEFSLQISREMKSLPDKIRIILGMNEYIRSVAEKYVHHRNFLYLGRGFNYPVALEGALKLKEISYIHAEGYPAAEMKHGPIALIDENMPVVFIAVKDGVYEKVLSNMEEVKARKGKIISIVTEIDERVRKLSDHIIQIPQTIDMLMPILSVIPLQLLAYHIAVLRGCDVDQPRNLAKSVTVE
ncbi:MAG: glutamine--fructose-6-phosphate transaminase (isomerizing) [Candidatus Kryptonium sp.]|nr:glutamine--fructose-6-phosphate transaminase (isomerizing) [Candidatus Kryptonium sp.]